MPEPKTCSDCYGINANQPVNLCPRHASTEALYEAASLAVRQYDIGRDIFWRSLHLPRPQDDDNEVSTALRAAIKLHDEGKE
jgi:hypothetical protein